jgi:hypothetical protein
VINKKQSWLSKIFFGNKELPRGYIYASSEQEQRATKKDIIKSVTNHDINGLTDYIKSGSDLNVKDHWGNTALVWGAHYGYTDIVKILIEAKANVDLKDVNDQTALMKASDKGRVDIVKILISVNADVNIKDIRGQTALIMASQNGHAEVVKLLVGAKADINAKDNEGLTALRWAMIEKRNDVISILKAFGAIEQSPKEFHGILSKEIIRRKENDQIEVDHTVCDVLVEILNGVALDSKLTGVSKANAIDAMVKICISGFSATGIQQAIGEFARDSGVRKWVNDFLEKTGYDNARIIVGTAATKSRLEWDRKMARPESEEDILKRVLCEGVAKGILTRIQNEANTPNKRDKCEAVRAILGIPTNILKRTVKVSRLHP